MTRAPSEFEVARQPMGGGRFLTFLFDVERWSLGVRRFLV